MGACRHRVLIIVDKIAGAGGTGREGNVCMPLRNEFGRIAAIAPVLRQSAKPEVIPLPSPQRFSASPSLAYRFLGQSIRGRVGRKSGHPGRSHSGKYLLTLMPHSP